MLAFITMNTGMLPLKGITIRELETRLTQKGQVTIPAEIRARLGLKPKDAVRFEIDGDVVRLKPSGFKLIEGYGAVMPRKRPENWKKIRAKAEQTMAEEIGTKDR
jgi:AbrB family looped-hinge helix DNA binding protein